MRSPRAAATRETAPRGVCLWVRRAADKDVNKEAGAMLVMGAGQRCSDREGGSTGRGKQELMLAQSTRLAAGGTGPPHHRRFTTSTHMETTYIQEKYFKTKPGIKIEEIFLGRS